MSLSSRTQVPYILRHLQQLTRSFVYRGRRISYINIYARPSGSGELEFIVARESGFEGIACVDDVARAVILALQVHEQTGSAAALRLAHDWLSFVEYMQNPDGRFSNFIVDEAGTKNLHGQTSRVGGTWWTARAMWALATAWRVTREKRYLRRFESGRLAATTDMKRKAVQALALMELYQAQPSTPLLSRICALCDAITTSGPDYFRDEAGTDTVAMWGYHQLQAVARAGRLFSRLDYLEACQRTVRNLIEPVIAGGFYHEYPLVHDHLCAYDISPMAQGLGELYEITHEPHLRDLALECAAWLDGKNPCGAVMYDRYSGRCSDGITCNEASLNCGAESTIEAGFIELLRGQLQRTSGKQPAWAAAAVSALLSLE